MKTDLEIWNLMASNIVLLLEVPVQMLVIMMMLLSNCVMTEEMYCSGVGSM